MKTDTKKEFDPAIGIGPLLELEEFGIAELFEAQVERVPDTIAVIWEDTARGRAEISYRELNVRSNRLAHRLRELGVKQETLVGICLERSPELVVAVMAVLKAGGAYVPLPPDAPAQRLRFTVTDSSVAAIITDRASHGVLPEVTAPLLFLDELSSFCDALSDDNPTRDTSPNQLASIAYTSGSTGIPKGVMVPHRGVLNRVLSWWVQTPSRPDDVVSNYFDFSVLPFLNAIMYAASQGLPMLLLSMEETTDPGHLVDSLRRNGVTHGGLPIALTPAMLDHWPDLGAVLSGLRYWRFGGGGINKPLWQRLRLAMPQCRLELAFGATETSAGCIELMDHPELEIGERVPSGYPIPNMRVYVVDDRGEGVAPGELGEIWIGGPGLVRGYLNRPDATAERFVPDPFGDTPGGRLYRTGDVGCFLPNGMLEVHGRLDHLVKVRNNRVELGEVERTLATHPFVRECVVSVYGEDPHKSLAAYFVPHEGSSPTVTELASFLRERLPSAYVPSRFLPVGSIPLNAAGKPDREALPRPDDLRPHLAVAYVAPRTSLETVIVQVWEEVLGYRKIGVQDDFLDLGGHSLAAMRIAARIKEAIGVDSGVPSILRHGTPRALAAHLSNAAPGARLERRAELYLTVSRLSDEDALQELAQASKLVSRPER